MKTISCLSAHTLRNNQVTPPCHQVVHREKKGNMEYLGEVFDE